MLLLSCLVAAAAAEGQDSATAAMHVNQLYPRFNSTGPNPDDYECISERASDYYGIGTATSRATIKH